MVGSNPVETRPLDNQDLFPVQQVIGKLLVIGDRVDFWIKAREQIKGTLGFDTGNPRNVCQQFMRQ